MTSAALTWGCAFLAFGPSFSLLFLIAYQKAQLIIVVTTSAFAFLLSSLLASLVWLIFTSAGIQDAPFLLLLPGVLSQFLLRCAFVALYHKVERVIQISIERHERQHPEESEQNENHLSESARLRLELNDWACAVAAGTGFGGMHAIMLYGTLLASESGNLGTLYQESCPGMPSLVLSALNAFFFSILDVLWMFLTYYGMRRRLMFPRYTTGHNPLITTTTTTDSPITSYHTNTRHWGALIGEDSRRAGNVALMATLAFHFLASLATMPNNFEQGCVISLPLLAGVVVATGIFFWGGMSKIYLPEQQQQQRSSVDDNGDYNSNETPTQQTTNSRHED